MPTEIFAALPQLAALIEKAGIIGVLLLAVGWLIWERLRLVKQNVKVYRQRDRARLIQERYRSAIVAAGAAVPDIADILQQFTEDEED